MSENPEDQAFRELEARNALEKRLGNRLLRPVHRSSFTAQHILDPQARFNPDGWELYDRDGNLLNGFDLEEVPSRAWNEALATKRTGRNARDRTLAGPEDSPAPSGSPSVTPIPRERRNALIRDMNPATKRKQR